MPTNEQYEAAAKNLTRRVQNTNDLVKKMETMTYIGNLRSSQYRTTLDPRAKRLAENCYNAATNFFYRAVCNL